MLKSKIFILAALSGAVLTVSGFGVGRSLPGPVPQDEFTVRCPTEAVRSGEPVVFSVELKTSDPKAVSQWSVNRGRITNGQNSPSITVDTKGIRNEPVTATLEVAAGGCRRTVSCTTYIRDDR